MPIYECDPWCKQYFTKVYCPPDVHIPTGDADAYEFNPQHHWIYNKLLVAESQGLKCGLHGSPPPHYPMFSKPVTNLDGMGIGSCVLHNERDYHDNCKPGDFWMTLLRGEHISTDWAVVDGEPVWCRHALGIPGIGGTFDYWTIQSRAQPELERYCDKWIRAHLSGYTGMLNIETIGGRIIEAHLRFADQWPDLYGTKWFDAVVRLYQHKVWDFAEERRSDSYSVTLFGPHGIPYVHPTKTYQDTQEVSSVQITFNEHEANLMPPGGFRLAIINSFNLEAGIRLRAIMARDFGLS